MASVGSPPLRQAASPSARQKHKTWKNVFYKTQNHAIFVFYRIQKNTNTLLYLTETTLELPLVETPRTSSAFLYLRIEAPERLPVIV